MSINHNPFFNHSKVFSGAPWNECSLLLLLVCVCLCVLLMLLLRARSVVRTCFLVSFFLWNSLFLCFKNASSCSQVNPVFFKKIIKNLLFVSDQVHFFIVSNTLEHSGGGFRRFRFSRGSTFDSI